MSDEHEHEGIYEMAMRFVVVESADGPYADDPYVAGWEMGALAARLAAAEHHGLGLPEVVIHRPNVPQADLLAMSISATMTVHDWEDNIPAEAAAEWAKVSFEWAPA